MNLLTPALSSHTIHSLPVAARLLINPGEVYHLPETGRCIRVVSGQAWLTVQGQDIVLSAKDEARLAASHEPKLVSALNRKPLVVEVWNA